MNAKMVYDLIDALNANTQALRGASCAGDSFATNLMLLAILAVLLFHVFVRSK